MKKNYFKLILVMMVLMFCCASISVLAMEKRDAKVTSNTETKTTFSLTEKDRKALCEKVSQLIKNRTIEKYALDSVIVPDIPKTDSILNIDIDGDDISDKIIRSCGTGECGLEIELSGGGKIEFDTSPFFLIRLEGQIYVLVGVGSLSNPSKNPTFGLYIVNKSGVELICDTYKERR